MKFSKSVMNRLVLADVDYFQKADNKATWKEVRNAIKAAKMSDKEYIEKYKLDDMSEKAGAVVKENKNASLHASLDELLEKARPRASERKDPNRRKAEAADDSLIIPDTKHVQTMSNPGPTEAEHYERTKGDSIENLKRLAESKHPMDRKAAAAGMKKHE